MDGRKMGRKIDSLKIILREHYVLGFSFVAVIVQWSRLKLRTDLSYARIYSLFRPWFNRSSNVTVSRRFATIVRIAQTHERGKGGVMVAERSMEKAAREEGHCSKGEKPCQERGRGLAETKGRRRGEASSSNRRREKAAEKEPIGCCAPAYLEAARYFLPKLFQLPAVPPPSSTENLLLSLHLLSSQHALLRRDLVTQDRNWQGRLLRRCVTVMSVLFGISVSMHKVRCGGCAFMED